MKVEFSSETVLIAYKQTLSKVLKKLHGIDEGLWTKKYNNEKWCIAEICEHLLLSAKGAYFAMLKANDACTRSISEKIENMKELETTFKNTSAPVEVSPKAKEYDITQLQIDFEAIHDKIADYAEDKPLNLINEKNVHPKLGALTQLEWVYFVHWHINHHLVQIDACIENG